MPKEQRPPRKPVPTRQLIRTLRLTADNQADVDAIQADLAEYMSRHAVELSEDARKMAPRLSADMVHSLGVAVSALHNESEALREDLAQQAGDDPPAMAGGEDTPAYVWNRNPDFPNYLRRIREGAGLSIRQAAPALGLSVPYLSRFETGGPAKPPDVKRLFAMADLYGIERREMLANAGVKMDLPIELSLVDNTEALFARMMLDPKLRPPLLSEEALHYIPARLKAQLIQWARNLVREPDPSAHLATLLDERSAR